MLTPRRIQAERPGPTGYIKEQRTEPVDDATPRASLAEMRMDVEMSRALSTANAMITANGGVPTAGASMAKVWSTETRYRILSRSLDFCGGFSSVGKERGDYVPLEGRLESSYLSSPIGRFGGGPNDIQRRIIATRGPRPAPRPGGGREAGKQSPSPLERCALRLGQAEAAARDRGSKIA